MDEMRNLVDKLNDLAYYYYVLDNPKVSDKEYDELYDRLVNLEKTTGVIYKDSPTKKVGGEIITAFKSINHKNRLYSLDKAKTHNELINWENRIKKSATVIGDYTVEYKYDGLTLNLTYENGEFIRAVTRGNGVIGEDVTAQVLTIKTVPLKIPFKGTLEVQGEGIMKLSQLKKYNETAIEPLKNARNAAAGAIRNLDPKITAKRNLDIIFYAVNYIEGQTLNNQQEMFDFLRENRFKSGTYTLCKNLDCVIEEIEKIDQEKNKLDFLIDGAVVKINNVDLRQKLGFTDKFPRWAIAFKFEAEEITTLINDVVWNVGRTGKLTPLALLEPVELSGATVKRATLNNYKDILRKKVKIGCRVLVRRSNDVIPEIMGATEYYQDNKEIEKPKYCPACDTKLIDDGINLYCPNISDCPPQITGRLEHFGSKDAMDIEGFSEMTALQLYKDLNIKYVYQLYSLKLEDLLKLEGFKKKKSQNLIKAIQKSKDIELEKLIYALAIPNIGKKSAKDMAKKFQSLNYVLNATKEELIEIEDFGEIMSESVIDFFKNETNKKIIKGLLDSGIKIKEIKQIKKGIFTGEKVVLTGTLSNFTRSEVSKIIEDEGGEILSSVSGKTTLVLAGQDAGSKLDKAKAKNIKIINEEEFVKIIDK